MRKLLLGAVMFLGFMGGASAANATVITVDTTVDNYGFLEPGCSLRNAVSSADQDLPGFGDCPTGSGDDTILLPGGKYELSLLGAGADNSSGDLNIQGPDDITIEPTSPDQMVTIDGLYSDRIMSKGGAGDTTLRNLSLVRGQTPPAAGPTSYGSEGGAIRSYAGRLSLEGILLFDNRSGMLGGALHNGGTGILAVSNSTITTNQANFSGGGIINEGDGLVVVHSSTIALNEADADRNGTGAGGGIVQDSSGPFRMVNTILADNVDLSAPSLPDCRTAPNFFPSFVLSTQALGSGECSIGPDPGTNLSPVNPELEGLADNGGSTATHALPLGSLAIDAGPNGSDPEAVCPATDQRVFPRVGRCDIGAYENDPTPSPLPGRPAPFGPIGTFDGTRLYIRLKCPARFKPKCLSKVVPVLSRRNGRPIATTRSVTTSSNRWKTVSFLIKPSFRARVEAMTFVDRKELVVRQKIRSKRVGTRKATRPSIVFHEYKVRVQL